jgi:hypothetical protein
MSSKNRAIKKKLVDTLSMIQGNVSDTSLTKNTDIVESVDDTDTIVDLPTIESVDSTDTIENHNATYEMIKAKQAKNSIAIKSFPQPAERKEWHAKTMLNENLYKKQHLMPYKLIYKRMLDNGKVNRVVDPIL